MKEVYGKQNVVKDKKDFNHTAPIDELDTISVLKCADCEHMVETTLQVERIGREI